MLSEARAIKAVEAVLGEPLYAGLRATRRSDYLWSVVGMDEECKPIPGGGWLVGDDAKVWTVSSNPGIHDWDTGVRLLNRLYSEDLAAQVEPEAFAERLREVTERRLALEAEVVRDARAGALRQRSGRVLP